MAKIQSSGEIKLSDIKSQIGQGNKNDFSLDGAENGNTALGYARINLCSPSRPSDADPCTLSEWYNYDHLAGCNTSPITAVYSNYTSDLCNAVPGNTPSSGDNTSGTSTFTFDADYIILTYQYFDGADLDTRTRIVTPDIGMSVSSSAYLGYGYPGPNFPYTGSYILKWGGDNQGGASSTSYEAVVINLINFRAAYPTATSITVDCRGVWWWKNGTNSGYPTSVGVLPVKVAATMYKGGTITPVGYSFTNTGYTGTSSAESVSKVVTSIRNVQTDAAVRGERIATLTYTFATNKGVFNNNDTTTPTI